MPLAACRLPHRADRPTRRTRHAARGTRQIAGFSLVEMVVALTVLATLALIGLPAIRSAVPRLTLRAEVRQLAADLRQAQQLALTEQLVHRLRLRPNQNDYQLIRVAADSAETILSTTALDDELSIAAVPFTGEQVDFTPNGLPTETGTLIIDHRDGLSQQLEVKPSGYIRLP